MSKIPRGERCEGEMKMAKSKSILSGPMFQAAEDSCIESTMCEHHLNRSKNCFVPLSGGHYNHYHIKPGMAMTHFRRVFPEGKANELNFVLFSTSGVHGTSATIEEAEKFLTTAPIERDEDNCYDEITFVIIQPRLCTIHYGNCKPETIEDIEFLKHLRQTSWESVQEIGKPFEAKDES